MSRALSNRKTLIVQTATEKVAETTLTVGDIAVGVVTFVPIPGYQEVEKNVIKSCFRFYDR